MMDASSFLTENRATYLNLIKEEYASGSNHGVSYFFYNISGRTHIQHGRSTFFDINDSAFKNKLEHAFPCTGISQSNKLTKYLNHFDCSLLGGGGVIPNMD